MDLQFPNARLFIHDLLANDQLSGPAAIVQASCEFGLIPTDSADELATKYRGNEHCACFSTAKDVLAQHFAAKVSSGELNAEDVSTVWSNIERHAKRYEQTSLNRTDAPGTDHCKRMAPALFDLILQEIRRYS